MTTKDKSHTPTQTELIEAELELLFITHSKECKKGNKCCYGVENGSTQDFMKQLAALVLKHRHDVYFQAFRDGVVAGRKEAQAMLDSSEEE